MHEVTRTVDITHEVCPMTYVRTKLALEALAIHPGVVAALTGAESIPGEPANVAMAWSGRREPAVVRAALAPAFDVWLPREAPPGDGGISLGQVLVAAARAD